MPAEALWAPVALRLLRAAASKTAAAARRKVAAAVGPLVGNGATHVAATSSRSFATSSRQARPLDDMLRRFVSSLSRAAEPAAPGRYGAARPLSFASGGAGAARGARRGAPFSCSSALRPSTTMGAFPRSAGSYGGGGGARFFSHGAPAPAEVVHTVSQAMRAFALSGKRARYAGVNSRGAAMYRAVSVAEDDAARRVAGVAVKMQQQQQDAPGAYVDFRLCPVVTAVNPVLAAAFPTSSCMAEDRAPSAAPSSLNADRFLDLLAGDFERAARENAAILANLGRLASLGDLPVSMAGPAVLRVRFPGVDAETVERLCDDAGLCRGRVGEDEGFGRDAAVAAAAAAEALTFPFAPDGSGGAGIDDTHDGTYDDAFVLDEFAATPWLSDPEPTSGSASWSGSSEPVATPSESGASSEGVRGIYTFLEACDRAEGVFRG